MVVTLNNCVFLALLHIFRGTTLEDIAWLFNWKDGDLPPDPHRIIDALMGEGCSATPIDRHPKVLHLGQISDCYTPEEAENRFSTYLDGFSGLTMGCMTDSNVGHMAYFSRGIIYDGELKYTLSEAPGHNYDIKTLLVVMYE